MIHVVLNNALTIKVPNLIVTIRCGKQHEDSKNRCYISLLSNMFKTSGNRKNSETAELFPEQLEIVFQQNELH